MTTTCDVLGSPFECETLELEPDDEGAVVASLVRRGGPPQSRKAVLYVHGFVDYFFQTELADRYHANGFHFYALDLRKYGRSIRPHQTPNFCRDIREYWEEIDRAVHLIRERDGVRTLVLNGHSTGGLTLALYAHDRRDTGTIDALFLNSPFLELNASWFERTLLAPLVGVVGQRDAYRVVPAGLSDLYGKSVHRDHHGAWSFDVAWKPVEGFPVRAGWLAAIRRAQEELHGGLAVGCPTLLMYSKRSVRSSSWTDEWLRADGVLDVSHIERYAGRISDHMTQVRVDGGMHDLILSAPEVRERVYRHLFRWLSAYVPDR